MSVESYHLISHQTNIKHIDHTGMRVTKRQALAFVVHTHTPWRDRGIVETTVRSPPGADLLGHVGCKYLELLMTTICDP